MKIYFLFLLSLIGPIISYFTLQTQSNYSKYTAILYGIFSLLLDLLSLFIFAFVLKILKVKNPLKISLKAYAIMWIFDIFDLKQNLRFLSNIGFFLSCIYLFNILKVKINLKIYLIILWISLYILDALICELIASSPIIKAILNGIKI